MIKNKGSIVPRYIMKAIDRKAQHCIKFGCKVEITGKVLRGLEPGPMLYINKVKRKMNNGTIKQVPSVCEGVTLISFYADANSKAIVIGDYHD